MLLIDVRDLLLIAISHIVLNLRPVCVLTGVASAIFCDSVIMDGNFPHPTVRLNKAPGRPLNFTNFISMLAFPLDFRRLLCTAAMKACAAVSV